MTTQHLDFSMSLAANITVLSTQALGTTPELVSMTHAGPAVMYVEPTHALPDAPLSIMDFTPVESHEDFITTPPLPEIIADASYSGVLDSGFMVNPVVQEQPVTPSLDAAVETSLASLGETQATRPVTGALAQALLGALNAYQADAQAEAVVAADGEVITEISDTSWPTIDDVIAAQQVAPVSEEAVKALAGTLGKFVPKKPKPAKRPAPAPRPAVAVDPNRQKVAALLQAFRPAVVAQSEDGVDHLNISEESSVWWQRLLCVYSANFAARTSPADNGAREERRVIKFEHATLGSFNSIGGMIWHLKDAASNAGEAPQADWRNLHGRKLRQAIKGKQFVAVPGLELIVADALWQQVNANPALIRAIVASELEFTNYFLFGSENQRRQAMEAKWIVPIYELIRTTLKAKKQGVPCYPDLSGLDDSPL
jgi:hypothetical protein